LLTHNNIFFLEERTVLLAARVIASVIAKGGAHQELSSRQRSAELQLDATAASAIDIGVSSVGKKPFLVTDDVLTTEMAILKNPGDHAPLAVVKQFGCDKLEFLLRLNKVNAVQPKSAMRNPKGIYMDFFVTLVICSNTTHIFLQNNEGLYCAAVLLVQVIKAESYSIIRAGIRIGITLKPCEPSSSDDSSSDCGKL
jgi:hypothetical protein